MELIIGLFHLLIMIYQLFYPILFNNWFYDIIYILFFYIILLSYILLKGECAVTLLFKLIYNNKYEIGSDIFKFNDVENILPFVNRGFIHLIFGILPLYFSFMLYKINSRTKALPNYNFLIFCLCYLFFILYLRHFFNEELFKKYNIEYNIIYFNIIATPFLLYNIYILVNKLYKGK